MELIWLSQGPGQMSSIALRAVTGFRDDRSRAHPKCAIHQKLFLLVRRNGASAHIGSL